MTRILKDSKITLTIDGKEITGVGRVHYDSHHETIEINEWHCDQDSDQIASFTVRLKYISSDFKKWIMGEEDS